MVGIFLCGLVKKKKKLKTQLVLLSCWPILGNRVPGAEKWWLVISHGFVLTVCPCMSIQALILSLKASIAGWFISGQSVDHTNAEPMSSVCVCVTFLWCGLWRPTTAHCSNFKMRKESAVSVYDPSKVSLPSWKWDCTMYVCNDAVICSLSMTLKPKPIEIGMPIDSFLQARRREPMGLADFRYLWFQWFLKACVLVWYEPSLLLVPRGT